MLSIRIPPIVWFAILIAAVVAGIHWERTRRDAQDALALAREVKEQMAMMERKQIEQEVRLQSWKTIIKRILSCIPFLKKFLD